MLVNHSSNVSNSDTRLIHQTVRIATQMSDPRKQKYFVLLILTGEILLCLR